MRYCGVCHSDLHTVRSEWGSATYPCVPGHEIVGRVVKVGKDVNKFKEGDTVGVGCMVDSCRTCANCKDNLEQFCEKGTIFTYNSPDKHTGGVTYGGYSDSIVVDKEFVLQIPKNLDLAATAPLLCAGITTYSPLRYHNVTKGQKVGVKPPMTSGLFNASVVCTSGLANAPGTFSVPNTLNVPVPPKLPPVQFMTPVASPA